MNYKINTAELRSALANESDISGIEKHLIQEGLKEIFLGNGPIEVINPSDGSTRRTITPSLEAYLLESKIVYPFPGQTGDSTLKNDKVLTQTIYDVNFMPLKNEPKPILTWNYKGLLKNNNFFGTQTDWNRTLYDMVNNIAAKGIRIHKKRYDVIIISPEISNIFREFNSLRYYDLHKYDKENGIECMGVIEDRFHVFIDYNIKADMILMLESSKSLLMTDMKTWPKAAESEMDCTNAIQILNLED